MVKNVYKKIDLGIVLSERFSAIFSGLIDQQKIRILPNGVPDVRDRFGKTANSQLNILFLSNLEIGKGILETIEALHLADANGLEFQAAIVGGWPNKGVEAQVRSRVEDYRLAERIKFSGLLEGPEKYAHLAAADVLVFPPNQVEGQPLVVLEAMMMGLPVIATDSGCISEMVVHGVNGYIVAKGAVEDIAEKLECLYRREDLRIEMGEAGRRSYLESYTERRHVEKFRAILIELQGNMAAREKWAYKT